ncbi:hypothetical protein [Pontibacter arcticus]|uniref:Uncharacterized protein n=1 Tax=Pontibacter arcticus TaxID=2080288 RepID=A0A364REY8_9BACT|nr:hypothetical protein [Pontibacter arcticus]RAU82859.1 hypothetical protein DP923_06290 [Pontibacter arcticus]
MKRLTKLIEQNISGKKVLGLFVLTNIIYVFMLAYTIPATMRYSYGMKLLDMMPAGYDFNYVNALFGSLGKEGRETYLTTQLPVDMLYPFLFGLSYCLVMGYFLSKFGKLNGSFVYLCILPIISGIADYLENLGIILMLYLYPHLDKVYVTITSGFSIIKSSSTTIFFIALLIVLLFGVLTKMKKKKIHTTII